MITVNVTSAKYFNSKTKIKLSFTTQNVRFVALKLCVRFPPSSFVMVMFSTLNANNVTMFNANTTETMTTKINLLRLFANAENDRDLIGKHIETVLSIVNATSMEADTCANAQTENPSPLQIRLLRFSISLSHNSITLPTAGHVRMRTSQMERNRKYDFTGTL